MELGSSMLHSQGLSNNLYPVELTQFLTLRSISLRSILILSTHICLGLPKGLLPVGLPVKIFKLYDLKILQNKEIKKSIGIEIYRV